MRSSNKLWPHLEWMNHFIDSTFYLKLIDFYICKIKCPNAIGMLESGLSVALEMIEATLCDNIHVECNAIQSMQFENHKWHWWELIQST